ncbi:MAG: amino acid adenylation domain-containing protein [Cytophagales bacterium]|nr:amino acid adenylation domain-containing protein [Cytophagales bacterium]
MSIHELINDLRKADIMLELSEGELSLDAPKGKIDDVLLKQLRSRKSELIEFLQEANESKEALRSIPVTEDQPYYPLSHAQRRLWVLDQLEEDRSAYNLATAFMMEGMINVSALQQALNAIGDRHETFRTSFDTVASLPVQVIHPKPQLKLYYEDISQQPTDKETLQILAQEEASTPFDLSQAPLLRVKLYRIKEAEYLLLFTVHHIIADGWSMNIFIQELLQLYSQFQSEKSSSLEPLPIQYKDFSQWHNELLEKDEKLGHYWRENLSGELPVLQLPYRQTRPVVRTQNGDHTSCALDAQLTTRLNDLAKAHDVSLFMALNALVSVLLHKYSGQTDIILGASVAGRQHTDLESLIGFFVNILPLRTQIDKQSTFEDLLSQTKTIVTDAFEHQQYPFDQMVDDVMVDRDTSRHPIFDINIVMHNNDKTALSFEGVTVKSISNGSRTSRFDMAFSFSERRDDLYLGVEYNSDLFEPQLVESMMGHFEQLCQEVVENPRSAISKLDVLRPEDISVQLEQFQGYEGEALPNADSVLDWFEKQAEEKPDQVALVCEGQRLTYKELNEQANRLAHGLKTQYDPKPEEVIAFMLDRDEWVIVSILGILKSGAAYLPIDTKLPSERKQYMLQDTAPRALLLHSDYMFDLPEYSGELMALDIQFDSLEQKVDNPARALEAQHLAYIIYTSGSTGHPKGVMIEHGNLIHSSVARVHQYPVERMLLVSPISFDSSIAVLWGTLLRGGTLVLAKETLLMDPEKTAAAIVEHEITDMLCVPTYYSNLMPLLAETDQTVPLRRLILAGEELPLSLAQKHHEQFPEIALFNEYGPTENTVWTTMTPVREDDQQVSIGRPIDRVNVFVMDQEQQLLPIGAPGELCIAGPGLARGYLNQDDLTAQKFVDHPFVPGKRIYRTGDLARWTFTGELEFLGRLDQQVKIRGYRIELPEIEDCLLKYAQVNEAAVLVKADKDQPYLCAFVSGQNGLSTDDLNRHLTQRLPSYMVPSAYVKLETMPVNSNGKLDRKQLLTFEQQGEAMTKGYQRPQSKAEIEFADVWQEVLQKDRVGIDDDFFLLGGDSLKAIRVIARLQEKGYELSLNDLFKYRNIHALSIISKNLKTDVTPNQAPSYLLNESKEDLLFAFPPLYGVAISYMNLAKQLDSFGFVAFDFTPEADPVVRYYQSVKAYQPEGPYVFCGYSAGTALAFDVARYFEQQGDVVSDLILIDGVPSEGNSPKTQEQLEEDADKLLTLSEEDLKDNQAAHMIEQDASLRQRVREVLMAYDQYLSTESTIGQTKANIHLMVDEEMDESIIQRKMSWQNHTQSEFSVIQCQGIHRQLFVSTNLEANASILNQVLQNVFDRS